MKETATAFDQAASDQAVQHRAALEQRVAELSRQAADASSSRQAVESRLAAARAQAAEIERQYAKAQSGLKEVEAGLPSGGLTQSDRKLAELTASEDTMRRKHSEASEAALQFKTALEFTKRTRSQAEEQLLALRAQLVNLTAEVAQAEERAGEERLAEERASRERLAAEEKAVELKRALDRVSMERAMYEEHAEEQKQARLEAESKVASARALVEQLTPRFEEARQTISGLESAYAAQCEVETAVRSEFDRARLELQAYNEAHERELIEQHLASLREAEDRAVAELAEVENELRRLQEAQEYAAMERARLESLRGPAALPAPKPAQYTVGPPVHTQIGHFDAGANSADAPDDGRAKASHYSFGRTERVEPAAGTKTNGTLALSPYYTNGAATNGSAANGPAAAPSSPALPAVPARHLDVPMTSIEDRIESFTFLKWGKRKPLALPSADGAAPTDAGPAPEGPVSPA